VSENDGRTRDGLREQPQRPEPVPGARAPLTVVPPPPALRPTVTVRDGVSGADLGRITPAQAQFLTDHLDAERAADTRYFIDAAMIDRLQHAGAEITLIHTLRRALGVQDGVEIHVEDGRAS
jgi:hypothetical protein